MTPQEITQTLTDLFKDAVQANEPESWQVEFEALRLLVLLSDDRSWLRALVTIAPAQEAEPFLAQLLEANFDQTQEVRYALFQDVLWGVFQHSRDSLTAADFRAAIARLVSLQEQGLAESFDQLAEQQIRQIVRAAQQNGQTLEATLQSLERFYEEGMMGDMNADAAQRNRILDAWRYQLQRFWDAE